MELLVRQEEYEKQKGKIHRDYGDDHRGLSSMVSLVISSISATFFFSLIWWGRVPSTFRAV